MIYLQHFYFTIFVLLATLNSAVFAQERKPRLPVPINGVYEGEFHFQYSKPARVQSMRSFGNGWSNDAHLLWDGKIGESCHLRFYVPAKSRYQVLIQLTKAPDYGRFRLLMDDKKISEIDLYSNRVALADLIKLGEFDLSQGLHQLRLELIDSHPKAKPFREKGRFLMGLDSLQLIDQNPKKVESSIRPPRAASRWAWTDLKSFVRNSCVRCHSTDKQEAELDLTSLQSVNDFAADLKLTQKIVSALRQREMPPEDEPQPGAESRQQAILFLSDLIDDQLQESSRLPVVVMRRLNRLEYNNAVVDLLSLRSDLYPLPERVIRAGFPYFQPSLGFLPDQVRIGNRALGKNQIEQKLLQGVVPFAMDLQAEHGFNNRGRELSISPLMLETFLKLARSIVDSPNFADYCQDYVTLFQLEIPRNLSEADRLKLVTMKAKSRLQILLFRAFRRPIDAATLDRYVRFFRDRYAESQSFSHSMKSVVAAILASPKFLFIVETAQRDQKYAPLNDFELASRLSFFLWSSIPDQTLLELAESGKLSDPAVLEAQVHNMLLSPKSKSLSENFARQWLRLDQLITSVPDDQRFAKYYSRIGCEYWKFGLQMMVEPLLLFESVMVEDSSIMDLIDSSYAYRSDELQSWYRDKIPFNDKSIVNRFNTNQQQFLRRKLPSRREGGVITSAAVMTMTSSPLRTSPITRGAWVAGVILNQPPPPPPDAVPEIEADDDVIEAKGLTLRQRLKQHQINPSCASCHAKIDPLGFVLENYDAVGRWRDQYRSGLKINTSGKLFGEHEFKDIVEFKKVLVEHPEIFTRAFSEHLLSYALGRKLDVSDKPAVNKIVRNVIADRGRFSRVVSEVVRSFPFRHKANHRQ
ncbi:DUF1592 domain-containing protein [Pirellulaceae bacterium]|nr:DUF1592 domain-containing protein [Pirellulaceae bacterium]